MEAVPPHVLLGADVVLHLQASVEDGLLLRRPAEPGESLVQGTDHADATVCDGCLGSLRTRMSESLFDASLRQAMYIYMKAAYLSMLPGDEARPFGEDEVELFR